MLLPGSLRELLQRETMHSRERKRNKENIMKNIIIFWRSSRDFLGAHEGAGKLDISKAIDGANTKVLKGFCLKRASYIYIYI